MFASGRKARREDEIDETSESQEVIVALRETQSFVGNAVKRPYFGTRLSPKRLVMRPASTLIIIPPESGRQKIAAMKGPSPSGEAPDTDVPI